MLKKGGCQPCVPRGHFSVRVRSRIVRVRRQTKLRGECIKFAPGRVFARLDKQKILKQQDRHTSHKLAFIPHKMTKDISFRKRKRLNKGGRGWGGGVDFTLVAGATQKEKKSKGDYTTLALSPGQFKRVPILQDDSFVEWKENCPFLGLHL